MFRYIFWIGSVFLFLVGCSKDPSANYQELSLLRHGFPITILAPDSPVVKTFDLIVKKDVTIQKGDDYSVQIFMGDASIYDAKKIKDRLLEDLKENNEYFDQVVLEEDYGFVYKTSLDSMNSNYSFNLVKIQGDKEFIFQTGIMSSFSEEQALRMYKAVKNEKN